MTTETIVALIVVLIAFLGMLAIRLHVGLSLMIAGALGIVMLLSTDGALSTVANQPYSTSASYTLTVIPLFILMGVFAVNARLAEAGFDAASRTLVKVPGGPALASLTGSGFFAAVTGSSVATVATMARVSTDAILKAGYGIRLAAGVVCAGGTLGVLIPPSIILVLYAVVTGVSIGPMLLAGIGPGLLTILAYAVTIVLLVLIGRRKQVRTKETVSASSAPVQDLDDDPVPVTNPGAMGGAPASPAARQDKPRFDVVGLLFLAVIFLVSIGTIYMGVATPTEAASFGAMAALLILLIRTRPPMWLSVIRQSLTEAVGLTAMTFLLMVGAGVFTYFLAFSGVSRALVDTVVDADMSPYVVLICCLLLLIPLGMFLDGVSMILIAAPLLHPILSAYGFEEIWIGILVVKVAEMALITPPVGMNAFVYSGSVPEAGLGRIFRGIAPFIIADVVVVAVLIMIPEIVTFLPEYSAAE
ncbi:TRAP transporter large permease subunit [Nesterenkonia sp. E16_7]|uniref:TRAP transporter large permease n=1 Tax=unclassified Nesterenkonia TaxID=2629769 RepID=UPI001A93285A|nr:MULTISPECIES: TRAP transporter large permease subunit [unclassified Nesterenkonia]MBO0595525.1 TRAP transporter large permease subunit [Nesterenkonia sp. E16_10]MBO0599029.1 TRAP transporter large permease subunit [Nesterenkonia sp. E16_7]